MNEDLRARIIKALEDAGLNGFRDTTSGMRPQWRASFSHRGQLHGERCYAHIYVPTGVDQLQVNCTAPSPELDAMPTERFRTDIASLNTVLSPNSSGWTRLVLGLELDPADVGSWNSEIVPHQGLEHRMILAKLTVPLVELSSGTVDAAVRLGLLMARVARESLIASWNDNPDTAR